MVVVAVAGDQSAGQLASPEQSAVVLFVGAAERVAGVVVAVAAVVVAAVVVAAVVVVAASVEVVAVVRTRAPLIGFAV